MALTPEFAPTVFRYGPHPAQEADLHLPGVARPPVVCLLHGGFWRMPHGRGQMAAIAADLAACGFATWNIEYRRLGAVGGGYPGTLDDVIAAIAHLAALPAKGVDIDLSRVIVVGHSAGGHLALHAAAHRGGRVTLRAVVGLAPIADLVRAHQHDLGRGAVAELMGGSPDERRARYDAASPAARLPLGVPQLIVHGTDDDAVPIALSRGYVEAARAAGDGVELIELSATGHMEFLDPGSAAHARVRDWLLAAI